MSKPPTCILVLKDGSIHPQWLTFSEWPPTPGVLDALDPKKIAFLQRLEPSDDNAAH